MRRSFTPQADGKVDGKYFDISGICVALYDYFKRAFMCQGCRWSRQIPRPKNMWST